MNKFISILLLCFMLQGCSLLKVVSSPFQAVKNSVPQSTETNKEVIKCKGKLEILADGTILCEKGFVRVANNYQQTDRKLNLREKIAQFITRASGYVILAVILVCVLTFSGFGWVIAGFFNMVFGTGKVLKQVVQGVQNARKNGIDLTTALNSSTDESVKQFLIKFKQENNIK